MAKLRSPLTGAFGQAIREYRRRAGLTQEQLAYESGLHTTYISQLERGLKAPSLVAIEDLSRALGVRPHVLIETAEAYLEGAAE